MALNSVSKEEIQKGSSEQPALPEAMKQETEFLKSMSAKVGELEARVRTVEETDSLRQAGLQELKEEKAELEEEKKKLSEENGSLREKNGSLETEILESKEKNSRLEKELSKIRASMREYAAPVYDDYWERRCKNIEGKVSEKKLKVKMYRPHLILLMILTAFLITVFMIDHRDIWKEAGEFFREAGSAVAGGFIFLGKGIQSLDAWISTSMPEAAAGLIITGVLITMCVFAVLGLMRIFVKCRDREQEIAARHTEEERLVRRAGNEATLAGLLFLMTAAKAAFGEAVKVNLFAAWLAVSAIVLLIINRGYRQV